MAMPFELLDGAAGVKLDWQSGNMMGAAVKQSRKTAEGPGRTLPR